MQAMSIRTHLLLTLSLLFLLAACKPRKGGVDLRTAIVGEWENYSLQVNLAPTSPQAEKVVKVKPGNWREDMKMAPTLTRYRKNGTVVTEYRTLSDSIFFATEGTWDVHKDSLIVIFKPKLVRTAYKVAFNGNFATFTGVVDFDLDKVANDQYELVCRKVE